jgi:membrane associated rhomboid family serine protease
MITRFLIVVNVLVFIWEIVTLGTGIFSGNVDVNGLVNDGALVPIAVTQYHEYWRIITGAFLHGSILHIAVNMYSLYVLGRFMEGALGSPRLLFIYMGSLVASGLGVVFFSAPNVATLGASGAIFGLFGALFAVGFKFGPRGMDLVKANIPILVVNLIFSFTFPGISWQAHVTGLLAGFIITFAIYFPPQRIRPEVVDAGSGSTLDTEYEPPPENVTPTGA